MLKQEITKECWEAAQIYEKKCHWGKCVYRIYNCNK